MAHDVRTPDLDARRALFVVAAMPGAGKTSVGERRT
jgi:hypothetical protein